MSAPVLPNNLFIREVRPGLEAVIDPCDGKCKGVILPSRKYPFTKMYFCYADAERYYGMTSEEAVCKSFDFE